MPKNKEEKLDFFWSVSLFLIIYLFSTWPSNRSCPPTISLECLEWPSSNSNRIKTLEKNKLLKCQKNIFSLLHYEDCYNRLHKWYMKDSSIGWLSWSSRIRKYTASTLHSYHKVLLHHPLQQFGFSPFQDDLQESCNEVSWLFSSFSITSISNITNSKEKVYIFYHQTFVYLPSCTNVWKYLQKQISERKRKIHQNPLQLPSGNHWWWMWWWT